MSAFLRRRSLAPLLVAAAALAALGTIGSCSRSESPASQGVSLTIPTPPPAPPQPPPTRRPDPAALPTLSPDIPFDVTIDEPQPTRESLQHDFDVLSWQSFIAMNWPALPDGQPDRAQVPGQNGDNLTVWETWKEASQIFLPGGLPPSTWDAPAHPASLPAALRDLPPGTRILTQTGKTRGALTEFDHLFNTGPLIDQNGRYARFETRVNQPMFDTIVGQNLYNKRGQASVQNVSFPSGTRAAPKPGVGSIMVKATWKILSPAEIAAGRFHATDAAIYTPPSADPVVAEHVERATVGLVGLHIVHKTASAPHWIWSTFEHVDNCPTEGEPADRAAYNFYNKATPDAAPNIPPDRPWNPTVTEPPSRRPQIVRKVPVDGSARALNAAYQAALRAVNPASVWKYYELIGTQWPAAPAPAGDVANPALETYLQAQSPKAASSCVDCHAKAVTTANAPADFTHLLRRAQ